MTLSMNDSSAADETVLEVLRPMLSECAMPRPRPDGDPEDPGSDPSEPPTRPDEPSSMPERPYETPAVPAMPDLPLPRDPPEQSPTFG